MTQTWHGAAHSLPVFTSEAGPDEHSWHAVQAGSAEGDFDS